MASRTNIKWYHKLFACSSEIGIKEHEVKATQITCKSNVRRVQQVVEEQITPAASREVSLKAQDYHQKHIVNPVNQTKWWVNMVKNKKRVKSTIVDNFPWKTWNPVVDENDFCFIFGKDDPDNSANYLYITVDSQNRLELTNKGSDPTFETISSSDNRLFQYISLQSTRESHLKHVATGQYVGEAGRRIGTKLILVDEQNAVHWTIDDY